MDAPTSPGVTTFGPTTRQKWLPCAAAAVLLIVEAIEQLQHRHNPDPGIRHEVAMFDLCFWATVAPLYALFTAATLLPSRIELGKTALILRRPYRSQRAIDWRNIQSIRLERRGSRRRVVVYGDDPDGRRIALPAPYSSVMLEDPKLGEKLHQIEQAWLAQRGDDWRPLSPPQPNWRDATTKSRRYGPPSESA